MNIVKQNMLHCTNGINLRNNSHKKLTGRFTCLFQSLNCYWLSKKVSLDIRDNK